MTTISSTLFVVATPDHRETFEQTSSFWKSWNNHPTTLGELEVYYQNRVGLSALYNSVLYGDKYLHHETIVFVHDDVSIEDAFIVNKLARAHQEYDVVGLAGGILSDHNAVSTPLWHLMCKQKYGAVAHPTETDGSLTVASFGKTPAKCDVIDGLFISVNAKRIRQAGVRFNEDMEFHCYDLAFCAEARNKGLTIGVWPIWTVHQGLGDSYKSKAWEIAARKYIAQYMSTPIERKSLFA